MDIAEKAKKYAEGKASGDMASVIEQAFTDGYNEGLNDAKPTGEIYDHLFMGYRLPVFLVNK